MMMRSFPAFRRLALLALGCGALGSVLAQSAPLAPGQVPGSEIQSWIDADGFAIGGVNVQNGCYFLIRSGPYGRRQTIDCPNQPTPFNVFGEGKVVGDLFCSKFDYPDGSKMDSCSSVVKVGENKFELRTGGSVRSVFYRLLR